MLKVVDKRNHVPGRLSLGQLKPNETFEWWTDEVGLDWSAPHRMLHQNSNYLGTNNRHGPCRVYILNMVTGKIHHRDKNAPVRRIDVQMCVFNQGELKR